MGVSQSRFPCILITFPDEGRDLNQLQERQRAGARLNLTHTVFLRKNRWRGRLLTLHNIPHYVVPPSAAFATVLVADLESHEGAKKLHQQVKAKGITLSALVNNAGYGIYGEFKARPNSLRVSRPGVDAKLCPDQGEKTFDYRAGCGRGLSGHEDWSAGLHSRGHELVNGTVRTFYAARHGYCDGKVHFHTYFAKAYRRRHRALMLCWCGLCVLHIFKSLLNIFFYNLAVTGLR